MPKKIIKYEEFTARPTNECLYKCTGGDIDGLVKILKRTPGTMGSDYQVGEDGILRFTASEDDETLQRVSAVADQFGSQVKSVNEEFAAPRVPRKLDYWLGRNKKGKEAMIYFHDDMDGIFSCIAVKNHLRDRGFRVAGYGVINYQEGWKAITIDPEYINICVDFADSHEGIDVYIDHHGDAYDDENLEYAVKTQTASCYEGIMRQFGRPVDKMVLDVINMVDSAKYDEFGIPWSDLLTFEPARFRRSPNPKLAFAGAFNQLLKRSDFRTFIGVVHNAHGTSIYEIFHLFQILFPMNNPDRKTGEGKDFVPDGVQRVRTMANRIRGKHDKVLYRNQTDFKADFYTQGHGVKSDGYQIIGHLAFVPSGTWANPIRARAVLQQDLMAGNLPEGTDIKWILLQYGNTLQACAFKSPGMYRVADFPVVDGERCDGLNNYAVNLLRYFDVEYGYENDKTVAGGHKFISSVNNILGSSRIPVQARFLDLFKNIMIRDLSGADWPDLIMDWGNPEKESVAKEPTAPNQRVMMVDAIPRIKGW